MKDDDTTWTSDGVYIVGAMNELTKESEGKAIAARRCRLESLHKICYRQ